MTKSGSGRGKRKLAADSSQSKTVAIIAEGQLLAGRYRVVEKIGTGGMGIVYKVKDEKLDGRVFALKALPPDMSTSKAAIKRLKKEALAAIDMHHSHIMALHSFDNDGPHHFLVMEYLDGPDLEDALVDEERFEVEAVLGVARQVCPALDYAHKRGIVHRDIKPSNLIYKTEGDERVIKIADFGIAYQVRNSIARLTGQDTTGGTMHYMPPEQLAGKDVDGRADQYALAASLYELLRGRPPFEGAGVRLMKQIEEVTPDEISGVPENVNAALLKGLAKKADDRFESCGHLLAALEAKESAKESVETVITISATGAIGDVSSVDATAVIAAAAPEVPKAPEVPEAAVPASAVPEVTEAEEQAGVVGPAITITNDGKSIGDHDGSEAANSSDVSSTEEGASSPGPSGNRGNWLIALLGLLVVGWFVQDSLQQSLLRVSVNPADALVTVDGRFYDSSRIPLEPGKYTVVASKTGYQAKIESVPINEGKVSTIDWVLERLPESPKAVNEKIVAGVKFCWCPPGEFMMGSPGSEPGRDRDDEPQHKVEITKGFWLGKYEVTQSQWQSVMGSNPSDFKGDNRPVEKVSWNDCQAYIRQLNSREGGSHKFRLPTEAEWEYACRAGTTSAFHFGDKIKADQGNFIGFYLKKRGVLPYWFRNVKTTSVGSFPSNPWGLHDMLGNVSEWCNDWYSGDYYKTSPQKDPMGPSSGKDRVFRGGGWESYAEHYRAASRLGGGPDFSYNQLGLRLLLESKKDNSHSEGAALPGGTKSVDLTSHKVDITFSSKPAGAKVYCFETYPPFIGKTSKPFSKPFRPGKYRFKFANVSGYKDKVMPFQVKANRKNDVYAVLEKSDEPKKAVVQPKPVRKSTVAKNVKTKIDLSGKPKNPKPGDVWTVAGIKFCWCPPGKFLMGSPSDEPGRNKDEGPQNKVRISKGFWLSKYELNQAQWKTVMAKNRSRTEGDNLPVEHVTWDDCQRFIQKLNERLESRPRFRLPTEAEWEYACRAGSKSPFHFGETVTAAQVNYDGSKPYGNAPKGIARRCTTPVGSFPANAWGLHDMHGNVWEWCSDWYDEQYYSGSLITNPRGPNEGKMRVYRGGSWLQGASFSRAAFRAWARPDYCKSDLGFRLLLEQ